MPITTRPPVAIPGTRRTPWSTMLLQEWATLRYPGSQLLQQVRLGPTSAHLVNVQVTPALEAMLRVLNWYADGVILLPQEMLIIEAKVWPNPSAVGQVLFYRTLVFSTPAFAGATYLPVTPVVLFAEADDTVTRFANGLGVRVEIHTPQWIADYLTQVQFRTRSTSSGSAPVA
jgi:hypothetical protein